MKKADPIAIERLVKESGLSYRVGPQSWIFNCPKCNKKDKLYIRKSDGLFRCWSCAAVNNFKGRPEYAFLALLDRNLNELTEILYGESLISDLRTGLQVTFDPEEEESFFSIIEIEPPYSHLGLDEKAAKRGRQYLESRGISVELANKYDLRYDLETSRVIFPVTMEGFLVGWQGRTVLPTTFMVDDKEVTIPKILSTENMPKDHAVMFERQLLQSEHIVLCEGPVDAIKCDLVGGNVATMGKGVEPGQIETMLTSGVRKSRIYICTDPDAISEAERLAEKFGDIECLLVEIPKQYKDIGEMDLEEAKDTVLSAKPLQFGKIYISLK